MTTTNTNTNAAGSAGYVDGFNAGAERRLSISWRRCVSFRYLLAFIVGYRAGVAERRAPLRPLPPLPQLPVAEPDPAGRCSFDCARTCPAFEAVDVCRFNALFTRLGVRRVVNSETVKVDIAFTDIDALKAAAESIGATFNGAGCWSIWGEKDIDGIAFTMPDAINPVVSSAGKLFFDDMFSKFEQSHLTQLKAAYSVECAATAAAAQGWTTERGTDPAGRATLRVYHPGGGYLDVSADSVDAFGFNGVGCHDAAQTLTAAIGSAASITPKPEKQNATLNVNQVQQ